MDGCGREVQTERSRGSSRRRRVGTSGSENGAASARSEVDAASWARATKRDGTGLTPAEPRSLLPCLMR